MSHIIMNCTSVYNIANDLYRFYTLASHLNVQRINSKSHEKWNKASFWYDTMTREVWCFTITQTMAVKSERNGIGNNYVYVENPCTEELCKAYTLNQAAIKYEQAILDSCTIHRRHLSLSLDLNILKKFRSLHTFKCEQHPSFNQTKPGQET